MVVGRLGSSRCRSPRRGGVRGRGPWLALLFSTSCLVLGACTPDGAARRAAPPHDGSPASQAAARRYWLRGPVLLDAAREANEVASSDAGQVSLDDPVLIELADSGRFRSLSPDRPLSGTLSASARSEPVDGQGIALYAQRTTDLLVSQPTGARAGRLHPGALLSVAFGAESGYLRIAIPGFAQPTGSRPDRVRFYAKEDAFGTTPLPEEAPKLAGRRVVDFVPSAVFYTTNELAEPFALSRCSDAYVSSEQQNHAQLTQFYAGVEVTGWYEFIPDGPGPVRCGLRSVWRRTAIGGSEPFLEFDDNVHRPMRVAVPPPDFVGNEAEKSRDALGTRIREETIVFLLMEHDSAVQCESWKLGFRRSAVQGTRRSDGSGRRVLEGRLSRLEPIAGPSWTAHASFDIQLDLSALQLVLAGPHFRVTYQPGASREAGPGDSRCASVYGLVGATSDVLRLLPGGPPPPQLVAWHADDEERWYLSEAACEAAKRRATHRDGGADERVANSLPRTAPGGVHRDCHPALSR